MCNNLFSLLYFTAHSGLKNKLLSLAKKTMELNEDQKRNSVLLDLLTLAKVHGISSALLLL